MLRAGEESPLDASNTMTFSRTVTAKCPFNYKTIGGGAEILDGDDDPTPHPSRRVALRANAPLEDGSGWRAVGDVIKFPKTLDFELHKNDDGVYDSFSKYVQHDNDFWGKWKVRVWAVCAKL